MTSMPGRDDGERRFWQWQHRNHCQRHVDNQRKIGSALSFNGTNAQVIINDSASLHLTNAVTLEAWVNPSSALTGWQDVIYKPQDNYFLEASSSNGNKPGTGVLLTSSAEPLAYGSAALTANTWTHLAMTYDGTTLKIYVNGALVTSTAQSGTMTTSTNPLQIGGDTHLRAILQGPNRRGQGIQHRSDASADPNRYGYGPAVDTSASACQEEQPSWQQKFSAMS